MKLRENLYMDAVTDQILRIHEREEQKGSFAVCADLIPTGKWTRVEKTAEDMISGLETASLRVSVAEDGRLAIYDASGTLLCEDCEDDRDTGSGKLSEAELEQMRMEGHAVEEKETAYRFTVVKRLYGGEAIYGLGDKTGFLNKLGYDYIMWNSDNPDPQVENPTFRAMYKSIPFFIVLRKEGVYGIFLDNTFSSYFDMGFGSTQTYSFGAQGGELDYYFIAGRTIADVIQNYTYLTGRAPLPQMWTLGYHQSRWSYMSAGEVMELAESFRKHDIPCDAIHLDIDYMEQFKVFTVDKERFPDMQKLSDDLGEMGIRLVTIIDPGTKAEKGYDVYEEGMQKGYFAKDTEGNVYHNVVWPGDSVYPDYTKEEVRRWWGNLTKRLTSRGIQGIWNDMNEPASFNGPLPDDVVFPGDAGEKLHKEVHNVFGHLMAEATYQGLKKTGKRPFVITRACYSGSQRYTTAWTGDNQSLWSHLQMSIPQLLNLGMSGMPLVGTDIGGFGANTTPELLCRWVEAGCFAPLFRNHSAKDTRRQEPWSFGEETMKIYRKYVQLRYKYLPYIYDLCYEESKNGLPILRPPVMNYQEDENTWECNDEYMVGTQLLVAPVTQQGARARMIYLPEGIWVDYWTGERIAGKRYILREAPLDVCPIYVKGGSILPTYEGVDSVQPDKLTKLVLEYYPDTLDQRTMESKALYENHISRYVHYQDNGVDFAYQEEQYNLYEFIFSAQRTDGLSIRMIHEGYDKKYQEIKAVVR